MSQFAREHCNTLSSTIALAQSRKTVKRLQGYKPFGMAVFAGCAQTICWTSVAGGFPLGWLEPLWLHLPPRREWLHPLPCREWHNQYCEPLSGQGE